mgnify:FL=1|jgi:hypothetical protein|tara:strand:- start:6039 stop:6371 length:333 start_codon:yes stop_codon:yes gene_type:complete
MKQVTNENVAEYITAIDLDYAEWCNDADIKFTQTEKTIVQDGRNYIKIVRKMSNGQNTVHSFIVKKATKKFAVGEILAAASWKAPAVNFARGTVFDSETWKGRLRWTGIL